MLKNIFTSKNEKNFTLSMIDYELDTLYQPALTLLAARPSMGKTDFAIQICRHFIINNKNKSIGYFALQPSINGYPSDIISKEGPLYIYNPKQAYVRNIRKICQEDKKNNNMGLIVIDYLQVISAISPENTPRREQISQILTGLKEIISELNIPIILLSQISRDADNRLNKRPLLSDLSFYPDIDIFINIVLFLYRPRYYEERQAITDTEKPHRNIIELNIAKHPNLPIGTLYLDFGYNND